MLTHERLLALLSYDPSTGVFTRRKSGQGYLAIAGREAGSRRADGYRIIHIGGRNYLGHRLAWFYVNGVWPEKEIDHINGDPSDNSFRNLREATRIQQRQNSREQKRNTSGFKGVSFRRGCWRAKITVNGRQIHLGDFHSPTEAALVYERAAKKHFGEFARP